MTDPVDLSAEAEAAIAAAIDSDLARPLGALIEAMADEPMSGDQKMAAVMRAGARPVDEYMRDHGLHAMFASSEDFARPVAQAIFDRSVSGA